VIVTRKKPVEQVLAMLHGVRRVALVGCASCAAACQTGGEKELEQMRQLLQEQGIETVGTVLPDECCHMLLVKRDLKPLRDSGNQAFVQIQFLQGRYLQGEITRAQFIHGLNQQLGASAQGGA